MAKVQETLNAFGTQGYLVTVDRATRIVTITGDTFAFDLLAGTGLTVATSAYSLMGFSAVDLTGLLTYDGNNVSGNFYVPQFLVQSYIPEEDHQALVKPTVNKSADGKVEVVRFGIEKFYEMEFKFTTNLPGDGKLI